MMRSRRNTRTCTWGCCGDRHPSRTYRTREKAALARSLRRGEA